MTDSRVRARLTVLQDRLGQPTPAPLEGQETIQVGEDPDDTAEALRRPFQPPLW